MSKAKKNKGWHDPIGLPPSERTRTFSQCGEPYHRAKFAPELCLKRKGGE